MDDRRYYQRLYLRHYDADYNYRVMVGGREVPARLMDISLGGARFGMYEAMPYVEKGDAGSVVGNGLDYSSADYFRGAGYTVAWYDNNQFGVAFDKPLESSYTALCYDFAPRV